MRIRTEVHVLISLAPYRWATPDGRDSRPGCADGYATQLELFSLTGPQLG